MCHLKLPDHETWEDVDISHPADVPEETVGESTSTISDNGEARQSSGNNPEEPQTVSKSIGTPMSSETRRYPSKAHDASDYYIPPF